MFTEKQLEVLHFLSSEATARFQFAKIVYFLDITVSQQEKTLSLSLFDVCTNDPTRLLSQYNL